jgi:hypothetical protein
MRRYCSQNQERLRLYEFQGIQLVMSMSNKGPLSLWRRAGYAGGIISAMMKMCCHDRRSLNKIQQRSIIRIDV